jgi:hypothetical protein
MRPSSLRSATRNLRADAASLRPPYRRSTTLADAASCHDFNPPAAMMQVSLDHFEQALRFVNFLWGHAQRIYGCVVSPELAQARELAKRIPQLPDKFTLRELYRRGWHGLETADKARAALWYLADLGWVREWKAERERGRPTEAFEINPACRERKDQNQ